MEPDGLLLLLLVGWTAWTPGSLSSLSQAYERAFAYLHQPVLASRVTFVPCNPYECPCYPVCFSESSWPARDLAKEQKG